MFRYVIFLIFILLFSLGMKGRVANAQSSAQAPLPLPLLLSGSFGELRETHFHSGIDLKTGGKVGVPVLSMQAGVVSRVKVSPVGYGNALYVEHADGTTTVYGHLLRFTPEVTRIVRARQYEGECFAVDLDMKAYGISFQPGDTLAFSGNTGSSGGPHLHFEYRDTRTEAVLNPLLFLKIQDDMAPKVRALYTYYMAKDGCVERRKRIVLKYLGNRKYTCGKISVPSGLNGLGLYLTDVMTGSWNRLGIYRMEVCVDGKKCFEWVADTCLFERNPLVNEMKDFDLYRQARETVYRTFGHYLAWVPGVKITDEGWINMDEGDEKEGRVKVADRNGNEVELHFILVAKGSALYRERAILDYRSSHILEKDGYRLLLGDSVLFSSLPRMELTDTMTLADGKLRTVFIVSAKEQPLLRKARLEVRGEFDSTEIICRVTDKKTLVPMITWYDGKGIFAYTDIMGCYTVVSDTVAPVVQYLGVSGGKLKFIIRDELSGIASFRGEVNGKWGLFEYDAKNDLLTCRVSEPVFIRGRNDVSLVVRDNVGNVTEKRIVFQSGK